MTEQEELMLMAYADGAVDDRERRAIETWLADDAEARRYVDEILNLNALAREAYARPLAEQPPAAIVARIMAVEPAAKPDDGVNSADTARGKVIRGPFGVRPIAKAPWALPMAAALALAIGLGVGLQLSGPDGGAPQPREVLALGPVAPSSTLGALLERSPSGQVVPLGEAAGAEQRASHAMVVASFRDSRQRLCREFELLDGASAERPLSFGVACRMGPDGWLIEGAARHAAAKDTSSGTFVPSSGEHVDALEGVLTMIGAGEALDPQSEAALISRGWREGE